MRRLLDLARLLRFPTERDRDRLPLCMDCDRERRDLGGGDLRCRDKDRLLERLPPVRLTGDRVRDRRRGRLDLERDFRVFVTERDRVRLPAAPRLGERVRDRFVAPRDLDLDLRLLFGDREEDLRPLRFGDLDCFFFGERELLRRFGDTDLLLGLGDFDTFFLGVMERDVERDLQGCLFCCLGDWDGLLLGDLERDRDGEGWRIFCGVSLEGDREWLLDRSFAVLFSLTTDCCKPGLTVGDILGLDSDVSTINQPGGD